MTDFIFYTLETDTSNKKKSSINVNKLLEIKFSEKNKDSIFSPNEIALSIIRELQKLEENYIDTFHSNFIIHDIYTLSIKNISEKHPDLVLTLKLNSNYYPLVTPDISISPAIDPVYMYEMIMHPDLDIRNTDKIKNIQYVCNRIKYLLNDYTLDCKLDFRITNSVIALLKNNNYRMKVTKPIDPELTNIQTNTIVSSAIPSKNAGVGYGGSQTKWDVNAYLTNELRIKEENNKIIQDIYNFISENKENKDLLELFSRFNLNQFWIDILEKYDALDEKYYTTIKQIIEIMIYQNMKFSIPFIREFQANSNNTDIYNEIIELLKKIELVKLDSIITNKYVLALKDKQVNNYPYFEKQKHHFLKDAKEASTFTNSKTPMVIMKHYKVISSSLPLTEESAIFFCQDTDNISLFKFMVIPNEDTPYKFGCFVFDVYIPPCFPNGPPVVSHSTSRKNHFRFNPNLYECGKVCLSLLGTWGGQSASEKWISPNVSGTGTGSGTGSTLFQVIMSIYSMVFSEDPWYNEPGRERDIDNAKIDTHALEYNKEIQNGTIKYAILNQLKYPEEGFEEVIKIHFTEKKEKVQKYLLELNKTTELNTFNSLI